MEFFTTKKARKNPRRKSFAKFTQDLVGKIPLEFLQKPFLENV